MTALTTARIAKHRRRNQGWFAVIREEMLCTRTAITMFKPFGFGSTDREREVMPFFPYRIADK